MRLRLFSLIRLLLLALALAIATPALAAPSAPGRGGESGAIATDAALHRIFFAQPYSNTVFVLTGTPPALAGVLTVPAHPSALAVDATRHRLYVASDTAGVLSIYDSRSLHLVQRLPIGGHPGGLSLLDLGRQLLITDERDGTVIQLPVAPKLGDPSSIVDVGPQMGQIALLAPQEQVSGRLIGVWARGFLPGEPVQISWGVQPLGTLHASAAGTVTGTFRVPLRQVLGLHLVVLIGRQSARARSALLNVVAPAKPKAPRKPIPPPKKSFMDVVARLLKPQLGLTVPRTLYWGPLKKIIPPSPLLHIPAMGFLTAVAAICIVLLVRSWRRRRVRARRARANKRARRQQGSTAQAK